MRASSFPLAQPPANPDGGGPASDPAWQHVWAGAFGMDGRVLMIEDAAGAAVARLALRSEARGPAGLLRVLRSATNGHSPYAGLCLPPPERGADRVAAATALLAAATVGGGWDFIHLQGIPESDFAPLAEAARRLGLTLQIERRFSHLVTDLAGLRDGRLPPPMGKDSRRRKVRQMRALEREGAVRFICARGADAPAALDSYLLAERASWKAATGELLSAAPQIETFYRQLVALDGSEIRLLTLGDRPIAGIILRRRGGELALLKSFFAASHDRFSPGAQMLLQIQAEALMDRSLRRIGFCSGRDAYRFLATGQDTYLDLMIWASGARPAVLRQARGLLHGLRSARAARSQAKALDLPASFRAS